MKTMMRTASAAAGMALLLPGCGGSPTAIKAGGTAPGYDGGYGMGSGNHEEPDSITTRSDTDSLGGYIIGTGN